MQKQVHQNYKQNNAGCNHFFPSNSTCSWSHKKGKHLGRVGLLSWDTRDRDSKDMSPYISLTSCFENTEIHFKTNQGYIYFISLSLCLQCFCLFYVSLLSSDTNQMQPQRTSCDWGHPISKIMCIYKLSKDGYNFFPFTFGSSLVWIQTMIVFAWRL